jgi:Asp-tRNA(Asn)/Glu-tRNA(Gln) amidotransferase A subunit family amidase
VTLARLAVALRAGELSPREAVERYLERIEALDPELNAYIAVRAEQALAEADALPRTGERGSLWGVPVAVKDNVDVAGTPTTAASRVLADYVPAEDSHVVARLRQAGAVVVGKLNLHEFAYGAFTTSPHFGPARNPWSPERICGGSSGGSGAAVAADLAAGTLGTDTAGSIRIPAGLCGLVGLKPTRGACPTDGVLPLSPTLDHVGPLARTPSDAALLLAAMSGGYVDLSAVDLREVRVGVARTDALQSPEVAAALQRTIEGLADAGCAVAEVAVPSFARALEHADRIIAVEAAVVHADVVESAGDRLQPETRRKLRAASAIDGATYYRALRSMAEVRSGFDEALEVADVLLAPGVACPAPEFGTGTVTVDGRMWSLGRALCWNMAAANLAGLPAIALPAGTADGLPVGVQLLGRTGDDERLLALAEAVARTCAQTRVAAG